MIIGDSGPGLVAVHLRQERASLVACDRSRCE